MMENVHFLMEMKLIIIILVLILLVRFALIILKETLI